MDRRFPFHLVRHFGVTERDGAVVVTVAMQEHGIMRSEVREEDAHGVVLEQQMMERFAGNVRLRRARLRGYEERRQHRRTQKLAEFHDGEF